MGEQTLAGLKVLDLTQFIAGPYCTKLLADYGADVIKIERPEIGDMARRAGPFPGDIPDIEKSGLFLYLNMNKKGITLNLKTKSGADMFKELVKKSDVLVESFSPTVMPRLGLSYKTLKKIKPDLVMASISNAGQSGPYRDWKGTELTMYALSGQMIKNGDPDREPLKHALNNHQYFTGEIAASVIMGTLIRSKRNGKAIGDYIDVSILETMVGDIQNKIIDYAYSGDLGFRNVAKNSPLYPYGGFPVKDGYVAFQGRGGGARWAPRLFDLIGKPELKNDPRFATPNEMAKNSDEFYALFYAWLIDHTKEEVFEAAGRARYPAAAIFTTGELLDNPQYKLRNFFVDVEHPAAGKLTYPGAAFKMSDGGFKVRMPAPLMGQHNKEVYCGMLGYSEEDLAAMRNLNVI